MTQCDIFTLPPPPTHPNKLMYGKPRSDESEITLSKMVKLMIQRVPHTLILETLNY